MLVRAALLTAQLEIITRGATSQPAHTDVLNQRGGGGEPVPGPRILTLSYLVS